MKRRFQKPKRTLHACRGLLAMTAYLLPGMCVAPRFAAVATEASATGASSGVAIAATLLPEKAAFAYGEKITVRFHGGPGRKDDHIAIYPVGVKPSNATWHLDYLYTSGTRTAVEGIRDGTVTFDRHFAPPGAYEVWLLGKNLEAIAGPVAIQVASARTEVAPRWLCKSIRVRHAVAGMPFEARISAQASDPGDVLKFDKMTGPAWLQVAADGRILGTPGSTDLGRNRCVLRATDPQGNAAETELSVDVFAEGRERVDQLKIMSHNMLLRWDKIDDGVRKGVEAIVLADADVVGFQESGPDVAMRAAEMLGWYYVPPGNGWGRMISRYPVAQPLPSGGGAQGGRLRLCANPTQEIIVYNGYHSANHSSLTAAGKNGATAESVLAEEMRSSRPEDTKAMLGLLAPFLANADTVPVFLTGDFNTSSHLDWTAATADRHNGIGAVEWPGSIAIAAAGMKDSFRAVHPDPVAVPGITWTPLFRDYPVKDRIDFIYYKGRGVEPVASEVFHTPIETTLRYGEKIEAARANTWPTDHASVVSTFRLRQ